MESESSKTDEAKLNEILSLLHRITDTLSAFEENPLLVSTLLLRSNLVFVENERIYAPFFCMSQKEIK